MKFANTFPTAREFENMDIKSRLAAESSPQTKDRRVLDRGRRLEDCSPLTGITVMMLYGAAMGFIAGYMVRAWWG